MACSRCFSTEAMDEVKLSDKGELHVFSIVHQSAPGIPTPYVAAIVDLPEGVSVRCNISGVEADPKNLKFGMPVQMVSEKVAHRPRGQRRHRLQLQAGLDPSRPKRPRGDEG